MASHKKEVTEEAVQFSFTQFSSNEIKVSVLKDLIEKKYGLPKEKQIIYSSFISSNFKEVEDDELLLNIQMCKTPGYMNLSFAVCSTAEEIMKQKMVTHGVKTIRRVIVRAFGSGEFITSDVEKCEWKWLCFKVESKTKIPCLHHTLVDADGNIYKLDSRPDIVNLPSKTDRHENSCIVLYLCINQNINERWNLLCKELGIIQLHTVRMRFLTREECFNVLENNLRSLYDVKEMAHKKFQIQSWNAVIIINGKQVSDNNASLFEFFLASNEPHTGELTLQILTVKASFEVFIFPSYEPLGFTGATKVAVTSEDTVLTLKEKYLAVKPDEVKIDNLKNLELCRYDNPALILDDHLTMEDMEARPKWRFHVRDTITIEVMRKSSAGLKKFDDFVFVKQYDDQRTYSDLIKHVKKEIGCTSASKTTFPNGCLEKSTLRSNKEHDKIVFIIDDT